ncbi:hypothetical protein H4R20_004674 [Coemansia guatemalensis]|uniref:Dolichyl-phosphate-mannose--protein mannosyltransferase n=1 Tax=Coemansia guatemalensis TaxID=2761395 RepID=A0A9W8HY80_9FUNG|nr:hypothetical protein H4R20_004674 [Coemansia guatemalensis]
MTVGMGEAKKTRRRAKGHSMQPTAMTAAEAHSSGDKGVLVHKGDSGTGNEAADKADDDVTIKEYGYKPAYFGQWQMDASDWGMLGVLLLLALAVRCFRLAEPAQVVFDEVHFGKFAGRYLNGTYFYDLHPPLAKLMFAAAGHLSGYDGVFDFKTIGLDYVAAGVPYVGMRLLPAVLGALTVPMAYATLRSCGYATDTAALAAALVCVENGLVTQSRLILLDSPLVFFSAATLTCWALWWTYQDRAFSRGWWAWLLSTGLAMGCAASCKWVGLFLFPAIGLSTIKDLWDKIADRQLSPVRWMLHFAARALALLVVPAATYVFWFWVHFAVLRRTGDDAAMISPEFQTSLIGGPQVKTDRDVFYGSEIRMRTTNARSGFLHSHMHLWQHEKGSGQQQVTIYGYADPNNLWIVEPAFNTTVDTSGGPVPVTSGSVLRLRHRATGKYLHSHNHRPAMAASDDQKFELAGYGFANFSGDSNDNFRLEILHGDAEGADKHLQAIESKFRLIHDNLGCAVYNSRKKLPKWAFGQTEANCMRSCHPRMSTWHIEHARFPNASQPMRKTGYRRPGLWAKLLEYNRLMADSNENLTGDHPFAARPQHWPWLRRGTAYWGGHGRLIYQLGNPLVWWASLAAVVVFVNVRLLLFVLAKRRICPQLGGSRAKYLSSAGFFSIAWACHYLPFFLMGRELFLHHYFPALWMAIIVLACSVDLATCALPRPVRTVAYLSTLLAALYAFHRFSYITYARLWSKDACLNARWLSSWDFDCEHALGGVRATDPPPASTAATAAIAASEKPPPNPLLPAKPAVVSDAPNNATIQPVFVTPEFVSSADVVDGSRMADVADAKAHDEL